MLIGELQQHPSPLHQFHRVPQLVEASFSSSSRSSALLAKASKCSELYWLPLKTSATSSYSLCSLSFASIFPLLFMGLFTTPFLVLASFPLAFLFLSCCWRSTMVYRATTPVLAAAALIGVLIIDVTVDLAPVDATHRAAYYMYVPLREQIVKDSRRRNKRTERLRA